MYFYNLLKIFKCRIIVKCNQMYISYPELTPKANIISNTHLIHNFDSLFLFIFLNKYILYYTSMLKIVMKLKIPKDTKEFC